MTKQELSQIALKILGIYALLESIQFITNVLNVFSFRGDAPFERSLMALSIVVPFLILLCAGTFLIRAPTDARCYVHEESCYYNGLKNL